MAVPESDDGGEPDPGGRVDLHTHSTASDGTLAPAALLDEAARWDVRVLGLTDHDTTAGYAEAKAAGDRLGIEVIPGVELSTGDDTVREIHLLGYFVDPEDAALQDALAEFAEGRRVRIARIVERLAAAGAPVDLDRIMALARGGTVGRPHVARAMIERGHVATVGEAFERYLRSGQPGFVPRYRVTPERAISLVTAAGGVATLAHPLGTGDVEGTVARLVPAGLGGLEVYYGEYDDPTRAALRQIADRWGLIPTGGSDFHGVGFKPGRDLGGPPVPREAVDRLRAASRQRAAGIGPLAEAVRT